MAPCADLWRDVASLSGALNFAAWFGAERPVEMEIGCGKGQWLVSSATARPDTNFVGVEKDGRYLKRAREKIERRGIANVRLIHGDMIYLLLNHTPSASLRAIHVYFPDPWPKRRHAKRRMFTDTSVGLFARALTPDGRLALKTDVPVNYTRMRRVVADSRLFTLEQLREWPAADPPDENVATNFEIKYGAIGKDVFFASWRPRRSGS